MTSVIDSLITGVLEDVALRQARTPLKTIKNRAQHQPEARNLLAVLKAHVGAVAIIAEIKRAAPLVGHLADIPDPGGLCEQYVEGGSVAVSVVTERRSYGGMIEDVDRVRTAVDVPVILKDVVITPYQVHEARAHGADALVMTAETLEQQALVSLIERTESLGMTAIVEAHSRVEALRALDAGARVVGVNARNLATFEVDPQTIPQTIDIIPPEALVVAESIARGPRDVTELAKWGADAVLVGEALVRSRDPRDLVQKMVSAGQHPALRTNRQARVKAAWNEEKGDTV